MTLWQNPLGLSLHASCGTFSGTPGPSSIEPAPDTEGRARNGQTQSLLPTKQPKGGIFDHTHVATFTASLNARENRATMAASTTPTPSPPTPLPLQRITSSSEAIGFSIALASDLQPSDLPPCALGPGAVSRHPALIGLHPLRLHQKDASCLRRAPGDKPSRDTPSTHAIAIP